MIIKGATVYCEGRFVPRDIEVSQGRIVRIERSIEGDDVFDASTHVLVPGVRNRHMHASSVLIRGAPSGGGLDTWVRNWLWRFEETLSRKEAYYGALYSMCQMARAGITYFEEMHFHETDVMDACVDIGMRASLSEAIMDRQEWDTPLATIDTTLSLARKARRSPLVDAKMGIVSIRMTSEELIDACVGTVRDHPDLFSGYHVHLNEVPLDTQAAKREYGALPAEVYNQKGVLGPLTTLAHCVHMGPTEMALLASTGSTAAICIGSNLRLRSGTPPVPALIDAGVTLGLGIDSPAINDGYDLLADMRIIGLLYGLRPHVLLPLLFGCRGIEAGMEADIVFIDKAALFPWKDIATTMSYGANTGCIDHVMVAGQFVVRNKHVTTVDEERVARKAGAVAEKVWSRLERTE
jgi:5-methylthioadenosine/S-adenosylhomocysteine deaminase